MKILLRILGCAAGLGCFVPGAIVRAAETDTTAAPTLEGTWRWTFTMPDGTTNRPKLKFTVEDGMLHGSTSFRAGTEVPVTNILVNSDLLSFQVVRQRNGEMSVTQEPIPPMRDDPFRRIVERKEHVVHVHDHTGAQRGDDLQEQGDDIAAGAALVT